MKLNESERYMLEWLSKDNGQYGECHGKTLNLLLTKGFVEVLDGQEHQSGFITKGNSKMYQAVAITEAGRAALKAPVEP
jgi:hypothetical protein